MSFQSDQRFNELNGRCGARLGFSMLNVCSGRELQTGYTEVVCPPPASIKTPDIRLPPNSGSRGTFSRLSVGNFYAGGDRALRPI
jgi:hypothetical protein